MSDLATRLRTACDQVRVKSYPLSDLIPLMQQAADALAAAPRQPALHPITGEPIGTDAQEATAWQVKAENLERENAALRELIAEAPSYFAPQYDFEGRKLAWIKSADASIAAQGDSHE